MSWDHAADYPLPTNWLPGGAEGFTKTYDLDTEAHAFLADHTVDGRIILPVSMKPPTQEHMAYVTHMMHVHAAPCLMLAAYDCQAPALCRDGPCCKHRQQASGLCRAGLMSFIQHVTHVILTGKPHSLLWVVWHAGNLLPGHSLGGPGRPAGEEHVRAAGAV